MRVRWWRLLAFGCATLAVVVLLVAVGLFIAGYQRRRSMAEADAARSRVHVGMTIVEAEPLMSGAWRHVRCQYGPGADHVYLFGSHNLDDTGIVLLRTEVEQGREVVTFVGSDENYRLNLYQSCAVVG